MQYPKTFIVTSGNHSHQSCPTNNNKTLNHFHANIENTYSDNKDQLNTDALYRKGQSRIFFLRRLIWRQCGYAEHVLSNCGGQCTLRCSSVLGRQPEEKWCQERRIKKASLGEATGPLVNIKLRARMSYSRHPLQMMLNANKSKNIILTVLPGLSRWV